MSFLEKVKHTSVAISKYIKNTELFYSHNLFLKFQEIKSGLNKRINSILALLK